MTAMKRISKKERKEAIERIIQQERRLRSIQSLRDACFMDPTILPKLTPDLREKVLDLGPNRGHKY